MSTITDADIRAYNGRRSLLRSKGLSVPPDLYGQDMGADALTDPGTFIERVDREAADAEAAELLTAATADSDFTDADLIRESNVWLREAERHTH